jgi:hypothetical protein
MSNTLEARKHRIVDYLAELDDEALVLQIENLLFPRTDWWDTISAQEKAAILKGIEDAESGKKTDFNTFIEKLRQKHHARQHNG